METAARAGQARLAVRVEAEQVRTEPAASLLQIPTDLGLGAELAAPRTVDREKRDRFVTNWAKQITLSSAQDNRWREM